MSDIQITKGPWEVCFDHPDEDTRASLAFIRPRGEVYGGEEIADIFCCGGDTEREANARLIAAAPDLYAALEEIINTPWIGGKGGFVRARAALAKARGEQ
jgi:hypothetical protein